MGYQYEMYHHTTVKGKLGESRVRSRAIEKGIIVSEPEHESIPYDFIFDCDGELHRVQVKAVESDGVKVEVWLRSNSKKDNRSYEGLIDYIICYDSTTDHFFKLDMLENSSFTIRYEDSKHGDINWYEDYLW